MKNNQIKSLRNWSCGSALVPVLKNEAVIITLNADQVSTLLGTNNPQNKHEEYKLITYGDGSIFVEISYHDHEFDIDVVEEYTPIDGVYQKTRHLHFHKGEETGVDILAE